jgi:tetratricopeptide (TPR) repeat protein
VQGLAHAEGRGRGCWQLRFKIFRNIGNAFVRLGQFQDAIQSFETVMGGNADFQTGFNLILCYYALGDTERMKRGFTKLLAVPINGMAEDEEEVSRRHTLVSPCASRPRAATPLVILCLIRTS